MKKQLICLSIASVLAVAGTTPTYADECVSVQSRFALANCLVESAVAIAAAAATKNGCAERSWDIDAIVPELIYSTIPVQGLALVSGNGDAYELNGSSSAMMQNSVNCSISTASSGNTFDGDELVYATGSGNYYVDAVIDPDSYTLCLTSSVSSGDIGLDDENMDEENFLLFTEVSDVINADGLVTILGSSGHGNSPNHPPVILSDWTVHETADIPELGELAEDAFVMNAVTNDIGDCAVTVEGSIQNLLFYEVEGESGGLTISGKIKIGAPEDDDEEDD